MERETNAMNDIILLKSELAILKAEIKENIRKYNQLLKGFNELIDEHTTAMERLGESDSSQIRYDYFEKAGILD
jgi:flagellar capping protein FliD